MSIYLISNREVVDNKFRNDGKDTAAGSSFRIASCKLDNTNESMKYELLPDVFPAGYERVVKALKDEVSAKELKGTEYMFYDLYSQMLKSKSKSDVLFFIHGFANSFEDNLKHMYLLHKHFVGKNSPIKHLVYLSWPTRNHKVFTYWNDQEDARETGLMLNRLYMKLHGFFKDLFELHKQERCKNRIHLAAHSMGNQVLKAMLESLPKEKLFPLFGEVLLLHSDVENTVFEPVEPFTNLEYLSERTHMYIHHSDDALRISRGTKNFNKRLGHRGPKDRTNLNNETFIVDTSKIRDTEKIKDIIVDHWRYLYSPLTREDILSVLDGKNENDFDRREKTESNYFILKSN